MYLRAENPPSPLPPLIKLFCCWWKTNTIALTLLLSCRFWHTTLIRDFTTAKSKMTAKFLPEKLTVGLSGLVYCTGIWGIYPHVPLLWITEKQCYGFTSPRNIWVRESWFYFDLFAFVVSKNSFPSYYNCYLEAADVSKHKALLKANISVF